MKKLIFFLVILFDYLASGQSNISAPEIYESQQTPSAPNAAALSKYFEIPVNMAAGIPRVEIPLYTIQSGRIKLPIILSYHAGGVKIDEDASWVGMNWSLVTGGSINRKVNGFDDIYASDNSAPRGPKTNYTAPDYSPFINGYSTITDIVDHYMNCNGSCYDTINSFFGRIADGWVDGEADEYFFSTPEGGGSFYFNQKTQSLQLKKSDGWAIGSALVSKNGIQYYFGTSERAVNPLWWSNNDYHPLEKYVINTWYTTSITDPVSGKAMTLSYDNDYQNDKLLTYSKTREYTYETSIGWQGQADTWTDVRREGDEKSIRTISFDEGRIEFIKDTATRKDGVVKALKEIQIYNNKNVLLKKFVFTYFYPKGVVSTDTISRMFLASVREINYDLDSNITTLPSYRFDYDTTIHLPYKYSNSKDYWGYYNGKSNADIYPTLPEPRTGSLPTQYDRRVDSAYTKAGILNKIVYPTGGSIRFEYENNKAQYDTVFTGGLRVKRITNYDSLANKTVIREYEYQNGEVAFKPVFQYTYQHMQWGWPSPKLKIKIHGDPILPLFPNQGNPIVYGTVTEKQTGDGEELRTKHYFTGYDFYSSLTSTTPAWTNIMSVPRPNTNLPGEFIGLEYKTEFFRHNSNNTYSLIKTDSVNYAAIAKPQNYVWNVQAAWVDDYADDWWVWPQNDPFNQFPIWGLASVNVYQFIPELPVRASAFSKYIDGQNSLVQPGLFNYDQNNANLLVEKTTTPKGDTAIKVMKYASNFNYTGAGSGMNAEIDSLIDYNVVSAPIEVVSLLKHTSGGDTILQSATLYEYDNLRVKKIYKIYGTLPYSSFTPAYNNSSGFFKDSHYQLYQEILAFDNNNNPLGVSTDNNLISYVWDSQNSLPVASVSGASYQDVCYTSFEGNQTGGWTVGSSSRNTNSITGVKSYSLSSGNISKSNLSSSKKYIVSYWTTSSQLNITGTTSSLQGMTRHGWTYYEHQITGVTSITLSGSNLIDELRLYPEDAMMVSNVYEPLLGITAICDQKNSISYYEYQGMEQLRYVRDVDSNIVKKICYNYAGQGETCLIAFKNTIQSQNFTRNNCPANYTGSTVTYTVPAGTYSSYVSVADANQMALNDISANGQNYANTHGTCTSNCNGSNCTGAAYKCINGVCEEGVRVITYCYYDSLQGTSTITYHYEWSDNSWSYDYTDYNLDGDWCD